LGAAWTRAAMLAVALAGSIPGHSAAADEYLGQILDAGARLLSPDEFKQNLVQRTIVGPTATGGTIKLMYTPSGLVVGTGTAPGLQLPYERGSIQTDIRGEWKIGEQAAICTTLRFVRPSSVRDIELAPRCQFWFVSGDKYYLADSDTDRQAKVLVRTIKP
jgi:hypothetical protein